MYTRGSTSSKLKIGNPSEPITPRTPYSICPICHSKQIWYDVEKGERVCRNCGFVLEVSPNYVSRLPFDMTYAPVVHIHSGKNLGTRMRTNEMYEVLAKTRKGNDTNKPIAIRQIKTIVEQKDHPLIAKMKKHANELIRSIKFDTNDSLHIQVKETLGRFIEKVGGRAIYSEFKNKPKDLASAVFLEVLHMFNFELEQEGKKKVAPEEDIQLYVKRVLFESLVWFRKWKKKLITLKA